MKPCLNFSPPFPASVIVDEDGLETIYITGNFLAYANNPHENRNPHFLDSQEAQGEENIFFTNEIVS